LEQLVKRIAVAGTLVAVLALFAAPAYAQTEGSVLPTPSEDTGVLPSAPTPSEDTGVLPDSPDEDEDEGNLAQAPRADALADTGFDSTTALVVGGGLLVVGGASLLVARRRRV
jgi:LPXTG-motif cell wall-anchored protein